MMNGRLRRAVASCCTPAVVVAIRSFLPLRRAVVAGAPKPAKLTQWAKKRNGLLSFGSIAGQPGGFTKSPAHRRALFRVRGNESAFEQGTQALWNRLVKNVIVKRVEEVFPFVLAGKKVADVPVDPRHCDPGLHCV
jgi:hypothetical protein